MTRHTILLTAALLVGASGCGRDTTAQPVQATEEQKRMLEEDAKRVADEERVHRVQTRSPRRRSGSLRR